MDLFAFFFALDHSKTYVLNKLDAFLFLTRQRPRFSVNSVTLMSTRMILVASRELCILFFFLRSW